MSLRKLLAAIMVVSLVLGLTGSAALANDEALQAEAIAQLKAYKVVEGDAGTGDVRPGDPITRAELMKILTVAAGLTDTADLLQPYANPFSDVAAGAWYTGYIAVAKSKGWTTGYPDGTFQPGKQVTYAEAIAFLSRLTGLQPAAGAWPVNYITAAVEAGLVPSGLDLSAKAGEAAIRGDVFVLSHNSFLKVRDEAGKNLYQRVFDSVPPVVTLNKVDAETTAAKLTVSGTVEDAVAAYLNGEPLALNEDGSFSAEVELAVGANEIKVTAVDAVGNEGSAVATVSRVNTEAASIEAQASLEVEAAGTGTVAYSVKDTNGAEIPGAAVTATVAPAELGTFDAATGTFTAGTAAGTGTITLAAGEASATVAVTVKAAALARIEVVADKTSVEKGDIVTLTTKGYDAYGNEVTGLTPTYSVDKPGVFVNNAGQFIGSEPGVYTVTATAEGFTATTTVGIYGEVAEVKLSGPSTVVGNAESKATFTATLVDEFGNVVAGKSETGGLSVTVSNGLNVGTATAPATSTTVDIKNGVATFSVTGDVTAAGLVGQVTVTHTTLKAEASLEVVEQVATAIKVVKASKYLAANDNMGEASVEFAVVDQDGVNMKDGIFYDLDLAINSDAPAVLVNSVDTYVDGDPAVASLKSVKNATGAVTVTASAEGLGSASATVTADLAGNPAKLVLSADKTSGNLDDVGSTGLAVTLSLTDAKGIPVKAELDGKVTFTSAVDDISETTTSYLYLDPADKKSATVDTGTDLVGSITFNVITTKAGTVTLGLEDFKFKTSDGRTGDLSGNTLALTYEAGAAKTIAFDWDESKALFVGLNNPSAQMTVVTKDQYGNATAQSGVEFTVHANVADEVTVNGKTVGTDAATGYVGKTGADGKAVLEITTRPYVTTYTLTLTGKSTGVTAADPGDNVSLMPVAQVPTTVATTIKYLYLGTEEQSKSTVTAGDRIRFRVTVKDQYGAVLDATTLKTYLKLSFADGAVDLDGDMVGDNLDDYTGSWLEDGNDVYVDLQVAKAGTLTLTAELSATATKVSSSASVGVRPGAATKIVAAEATDGKVKVKSNTPTAITLRVADDYGNIISSTATTWTAYVESYADGGGNVEARLTSDGSWLAPGTVAVAGGDEPIDPFTLKGSRKLYVVGKLKGTTDSITFTAFYDENGDGVKSATETRTITGTVAVEIEE